MRFLLDPRLHLLLIAGVILAVAIGFRAERDWQRYAESPLSMADGGEAYMPAGVKLHCSCHIPD
jgi:hypothetical protein